MAAHGEDVAWQLEFIPAGVRGIRHGWPKLSCARCDTLVQPPSPSRPIARGIAGQGFLAVVLVSMYRDHLPFFRESQIYAREGVELERSTLTEWVSGQFTA